MKVELDLSTEQLQELDNNLTNLLSNLNNEQKMEIIKSYINYQFDKLTYTYTTSWGGEKEELSQFGKELINGLQKQISQSISDKILDDENLKQIIDDNIKEIIKNLENIVTSAISQYVIDNLFTSKEQLNYMIKDNIYQILRDNRS